MPSDAEARDSLKAECSADREAKRRAFELRRLQQEKEQRRRERREARHQRKKERKAEREGNKSPQPITIDGDYDEDNWDDDDFPSSPGSPPVSPSMMSQGTMSSLNSSRSFGSSPTQPRLRDAAGGDDPNATIGGIMARTVSGRSDASSQSNRLSPAHSRGHGTIVVQDEESDYEVDSQGEFVQVQKSFSPTGTLRGSVQLSRRTHGSAVVRLPGEATGLQIDGAKVASKKQKFSLLGAVGGAAKKTGGGIMRTGTTLGLLLGVVPPKSQRDFVKSKFARFLPKKHEVGQKRVDMEDGSGSESDLSEDSEVERMREEHERRKQEERFKRQTTKNLWDSLWGRAREQLGLPEEEEYGCWLKTQQKTGILWLRLKIVTTTLQNQERPPNPGLKSFVNSLKFELLIGFMIAINAIVSGVDAMYKPGQQRDGWVTIAENAFVFIFVVEYFLRLKADTWVWMFQPMNMFDTFVVWITGVLVVWILEPMGIEIDILRRLAALRVLRLGRLAKAVRTVPAFHELWMLVSGVMECTRLLFWSAVIVGIVHFMFAVAVMETVTKSTAFEDDELVQNLFGSLGYSMFTLFQIMTFDSWAGIVRHVMAKMPEAGVIFFLFMGIAGIVLCNLMTAVVVKNAFDAAEQDEEAKAQQKVQQQAKMSADLKEMFTALDEDGSGTLSREEFTDVLDDLMFVRQMKLLDIDLEELPDIFDILDDGDGAITTDEFCMGILRLQGVAMSRDMLRCTARNKNLNMAFSVVTDTMSVKVDKTLEMIEVSMESSHENLVELQQMTAEVLKKLEEAGLHRAVRSTTECLEELLPPTAEEVAAREQAEARKRDMEKMQAKMKKAEPQSSAMMRQATLKASMENKSVAESFRAIPTTWVLNRKKEIEDKKRALKARLAEEAFGSKEEEEIPLPGVPAEFQETWTGLEVKPALQTKEFRLAQIKAAQTKTGKAAEKEKQEKFEKGVVEKQLPPGLPATLAPRTPFKTQGDAVEQPEETEEKKPKKDIQKMPRREDIQKMNMKQLKEFADTIGLDYTGMKKVQLIPAIFARLEELENEGKVPISLM